MASRTAPREEIRAHVASAVSPEIVGNSLLAAELRSRLPLTRVPLTPQNHQALDVMKGSTGERNSALLSSVMRVGFVCM